MKEKDLIQKWLANDQLSKEEEKAFKNLDAYEAYTKIVNTAKKFKAPEYIKEENYQELKKHLKPHSVKESRSIDYYLFLRIAAVFIICFGCYFAFFYNPLKKVETLASQKTVIELPDQSLVEVNTLSSLTYSEKKWHNNRKINLKGEAYFKVAKGQTFDVETEDGIVTVIGTEFNVKQRKGFFEVSCFEGLIRVSRKGETFTLSAGKQIKIIHGKLFANDISERKPDWMNNQSSFTSTPYNFVITEFERQYNVTILTKNIDLATLFTGSFEHTNMENALKAVTIPMRLNYEINDNVITLTKD